MLRTPLSLNHWLIRLTLGVLLLSGPVFGAGETVGAPCTPAERWAPEMLEKWLPRDTRPQFVKFLSGEWQPFAAFAEIIGLRADSPTGEKAAFIDYWLGRTLFAVGLYSEAAIYFDKLVSLPPKLEFLPIQMASMACLQRVHELAPRVEYSKSAIANIPAYYEPWLVPKPDLPILWEATVHYALSLIKDGNKKGVDDALILLEGSGAYEQFVQGIWAVHQKETEVAASSFEKLLSTGKLPPSLSKRKNELLILLGASLYGMEDYKGAAKKLEMVDKRSNDLVQAQSLLASAQLLSDDVSKSLATGAVLKSEVFRKTFAPEVFTTLSMGLIEFCLYPQAKSILNDFRRDYETSYRWLKRQAEGGEGSAPTLYPLAIAYLEGKEVQVPERVAGEWIRSPIVISHQAAINSVFEGARAVDRLAEGVRTARAAAVEELKESEEGLKEAKAREQKKTESDSLNGFEQAAIRLASNLVKTRQERLDRLDKAEPQWEAFLKQHRDSASKETAKLGLAMETHLKKMTVRMFNQLERVIEQNEVVEAELLNYAGQDLVLQSGEGTSAEVRRPASRRDSEAEARGPEVWDDELGVSEVIIQSKCVMKKNPLRRLSQ